ncbi:hypothetical protein RGUI_0607 [Rhodovulum sp. P5]|nr:hypothetical protein RGUI_0607 [Rhodovulum sp. P5]
MQVGAIDVAKHVGRPFYQSVMGKTYRTHGFEPAKRPRATVRGISTNSNRCRAVNA